MERHARRRRPWTVLCAALLVTVALPIASAQALTLTSTERVFSFDLTNGDPPPPYLAIRLDILFDAVVAENQLQISNYGGADGTELITMTVFPPAFFLDGVRFQGDTANPIFDPMLDGIYSFGLTALSGSLNIREFTSCGLKTLPDLTQFCASVDVDAPSVPEPGTLSLFAAGLLALGFIRWRTQAQIR